MFLKEVIFNFSKLDENSYLKQLPFYNIKNIKFKKNIIFLTGNNGIGKTTLMEALAFNFNLNKFGGSKNFILNEDDVAELNNYIKIIKDTKKPKDAFFFRSDTFFNLDSELNRYGSSYKFLYFGKKSFDKQSHGESFMSFFNNRIMTQSIYFFDEPETALSFENQITFLFLLKQFEKNNNQIFIITHSPILLSYPNAQIINLTKKGIEEVSYEDTEQYLNVKNFLENYKVYQKEINDFE